MAVQPFVAGPAELYVHDGSIWNYLGYSESGARINWIRHFEDFMSDKSGSKMAADKQFFGYGALVSADLTLFNHGTLNIARRAIKSRAFGAIGAGDIGQLMMYQGNTYRFCIRQPYANAALWGGVQKYPNMPEFIHFWHAVLIDDSEPVGTKRKVIPLVWEMMTYIDPCTGVGYFVDTNPGSLPAAC
jgi:hypothetical protein